MAWYNTGNIALTNGSATVTGSGTNFLVGAQIGEALYAPDGKLYEIQTINSATVITLASNYLGSTASTQGYQIIPTQSLVADLASDVTDLISDFADVRDYAGNGKFNDGAVGTPGITFTQDQDNGLYRIGSNNWALAAGAQKIVDISTSGIDVTGTVTADGLTVDGALSSGGITTTGNTSAAAASAGDGRLFPNNTYGAFVYGNGTTYDVALGQRSTVVALGVLAGTANVVIPTGNLGIGTADLNGLKTVIKGSTGYPATTGTAQTGVLRLSGGTGLYNVLDMGVNESTDSSWIQSTRANSLGTYDSLLLNPNGGNLLVGKSATAFGTAGVEASASIGLWSTRSGLPALALNRLSTDGSVADFYKDGATVGSIGTYSGDLWIGQGNTGLLFNDGGDVLRPANASGGNRDGNYDLGASDSRFKDLYLSGGVYLGGTAAANHLDSYEEGTFTPITLGSTTAGTGTYGFQHGSYTKVGNLVTVNIYVDTTSHTGSGSLRVGGLPFTVQGGSDQYAAVSFGELVNVTKTANTIISGYTLPTTTTMAISQITTGTTEATTSGLPIDGLSRFLLTVTYQT
jgi:hypothetical protein